MRRDGTDQAPHDCPRSRLSAQLTGHKPIAHENNRTPYRLGTSLVDTIGHEKTNTALIEYYRLSTIELHTSATVHDLNWTRAQLCSTGHEYRCISEPGTKYFIRL